MNMSDEAQTAGAESTPPLDEPAAPELQRVNRILRTLSAGNRCLLHAADERALLQDMCRVIVEEGAYRMAWVGYAQHDHDKTLTPMAHAGVATGYFEATSFSWADDEHGHGASGSAVRSGKPVVGRNILTNPGSAPWRDQAIKCGFAAISAFPLIVDGEVIGNLTILAAEPDAFDAWEVRLLEELAADLAYGIANLRTRAKQQEAQATIARMAHYDALTSLPNRTLLRERVLEAISAAKEEHRSLALLLLSVERFHEINDTLGYAQGDQLLLEIVRRVQTVSRENELLARVGEADFALLLPNGSAEYATQVAQQIVHTLYEPVELPGAVRADGRAQHRHCPVPWPWHRSGCAGAPRHDGHAPGETSGKRLCDLCRQPGPRLVTSSGTDGRPASCHREPRASALLPAQGAHRIASSLRRRGAGALAAPGIRHAVYRRIRQACRARRADYAIDPLGARCRVQPALSLA